MAEKKSKAYEKKTAKKKEEPKASEVIPEEEKAEEKTEEKAEESAAEESVVKQDGEAAEDTETVSGEAEEVPEEAGQEEAEDKDRKARFGKGKKKENKPDPKDEKIAELTDRLQRLMAEFDNFRKRTEKEKASMYGMGTSSAIEKILPVLDNFERGLSSVPEEEKNNALYTGMDMIYKQLFKTLTDMGVEPIEAVGKEFDPNLHNAVMQEESDELESGTVAKELQKGYLYKGQVIRYSMVSVVA